MKPVPAASRRTVDFDVECVAAGYADPQWVPSTVTAWAYCWVGTDDVHVQALPVADFYNPDARRAFLTPLLAVLDAADVWTGHNIVRFDLPVLQAECLKLGLPTLKATLVQDTMRVPRAKGFKKGQDNIGHVLGVVEEKLPLNWAQWQAAYADPSLTVVKERVVGDVRQHMRIRQRMLEEGWLSAPRMWRS